MLQAHQSDNAKYVQTMVDKTRWGKVLRISRFWPSLEGRGYPEVKQNPNYQPFRVWMDGKQEIWRWADDVLHHRLGALSQTDFTWFLQPPLFCPPATMLCSNHKHFYLEEGTGYSTFWKLISMSVALFAMSCLCISIVKKRLSLS